MAPRLVCNATAAQKETKERGQMTQNYHDGTLILAFLLLL